MVINGNINRLFVPYKIALKLKEKGFDDNCFAYYRSIYPNDLTYLSNWKTGQLSIRNSEDFKYDSYYGCSAPLYQQVIDWFETKGIYISINTACYSVPIWSDWCVQRIEPYTEVFSEQDESYEDKYKALDKAIEEAIKLI